MIDDKQDRDPVVWVVEKGVFDYTPALMYGREIRIILGEAKLIPGNSLYSFDPNPDVVQQARAALRDYRAGFDYVVPTGRPVHMMLIGLLLGACGHQHNFLGWDDRTQRYLHYPVNLSMPEERRL